MSTTAIVILFVLLCGVAIALAGFAVSGGRRSQGRRLLSATRKSAAQTSSQTVVLPKAKQRQLKRMMSEQVLKPLAGLMRFSGGRDSRLLEQLVHAGIRKKGAAEVFVGAKIAVSLALPAAAAGYLLYRWHGADTPPDYSKLIMYCAGALAVGLMLPNVWLRRKVRARQEQIKFALPDALDLLVVCIESGLALDGAFVRIARETQEASPVLGEELTLMNLEVSAGKPREECLRNFGLRTGVDEAKALSARLVQAIKYGTNLAVSLRVHAESLRIKRRQEAEERAAKTTIKLLFPLVFFIFPAIFVVILGPSMARLMQFMHP